MPVIASLPDGAGNGTHSCDGAVYFQSRKSPIEDQTVQDRPKSTSKRLKSWNTLYFFLDPETIENKIIYFDLKKLVGLLLKES